MVFLKKTDYNTKVTEIENKLNNHNHDKHITTPEFNALAADVFNARLSRAYFKIIPNTKYISSWQSKGLSGETIKPPARSDYKLNPQLSYCGNKKRVYFRGSCLKQDKITFNHGKIVNIYVVYELN